MARQPQQQGRPRPDAPKMDDIEFRPAVRQEVPVKVAMQGTTGVGKTWSALLVASTLGERPFLVNTEGPKGEEYANYFNYGVYNLNSPYSSEHYARAITAAHKKFDADVIVVDSMTHEHEGEWGMLDWQRRLVASGMDRYQAWGDPKGAHRALIDVVLRCPAHLILCYRARRKTTLKDDPQRKGKKIVVDLGVQMIGNDDIPFECNVILELYKGEGGDEGYFNAVRSTEGLKQRLASGQRIDANIGKMLLDWSSGNVGGNVGKSRVTVRKPSNEREADTDFWASRQLNNAQDFTAAIELAKNEPHTVKRGLMRLADQMGLNYDEERRVFTDPLDEQLG